LFFKSPFVSPQDEGRNGGAGTGPETSHRGRCAPSRLYKQRRDLNKNIAGGITFQTSILYRPPGTESTQRGQDKLPETKANNEVREDENQEKARECEPRGTQPTAADDCLPRCTSPSEPSDRCNLNTPMMPAIFECDCDSEESAGLGLLPTIPTSRVHCCDMGLSRRSQGHGDGDARGRAPPRAALYAAARLQDAGVACAISSIPIYCTTREFCG